MQWARDAVRKLGAAEKDLQLVEDEVGAMLFQQPRQVIAAANMQQINNKGASPSRAAPTKEEKVDASRAAPTEEEKVEKEEKEEKVEKEEKKEKVEKVEKEEKEEKKTQEAEPTKEQTES